MYSVLASDEEEGIEMEDAMALAHFDRDMEGIEAPEPRPVVWFEILGDDTEQLEAFYAGLLGWGDRRRAAASPDGVAGRVGRASRGQPSCVTMYTRVPDLEAAIRTARALGGRLLVRPSRTRDGRVAVVTDPAGNPVGLIAA